MEVINDRELCTSHRLLDLNYLGINIFKLVGSRTYPQYIAQVKPVTGL